ncbi:serine--tRNA ligase [Candidatus Gottesmanbacteria bacterium RBG_16_37_8]|uniref:Serine--tRNA ligase n=1 Tax=Candidatus Gottesmanbacteria bacterium RBG_16_37_8 TaxID=1798371 RepID=A0A1F5YUK7_9BACT|nr:MAG: serine--tRNA ligase [Candidatus Gottesmanbacteria bacterium RBG_16_37_8]
MLDIKFIRENLEKVKKAATDKNRKVDFDKLLTLDEERRKLITEVEKVRAERNKISVQRTENREQRDKGKKLKEQIKILEEKLKTVEVDFKNLMYQVPNVPDKSVPIGSDASYNKEVKKWGKVPKFDFKPLDHIEIAKKLDLVDFDRGTKIAGFRGYFLKNEAALMEMGILAHTFKKLVMKGYTPLIAPSLVREFTLFGNGQFPWGREEVYLMEKDSLYLAGTAEVPVTAYFAGEVLKESDLPKKYVAFSPCFRREAGSYGKDTKGLYRLHQFNKVEQVIINKNDYQGSLELHEELLRNSEEVLQDLKLPFRVMLMCTGDMGEPQVKKYDIETFMPVRGGYGETMSNSFMGDFQTRRLNIRYKTAKGEMEFTHSLNNTAVASPRILIAILENYQKGDGTVEVPEILQEYVGKKVITLKK